MHQGGILLVEDDSDCRELALRALKKAGYSKVAVARDGLEAIGMLLGEGKLQSDGGEEPEFVLLDMRMPRMDGLSVLRQIRGNERTRTLQVFALSCTDDPSYLDECRELGVLAVLPKPLDPTTLKLWLPQQAA